VQTNQEGRSVQNTTQNTIPDNKALYIRTLKVGDTYKVFSTAVLFNYRLSFFG